MGNHIKMNMFIVFDPNGNPLFDTISGTEKESTDTLCRRIYDDKVFSARWEYWKSKGATVKPVIITIEING